MSMYSDTVLIAVGMLVLGTAFITAVVVGTQYDMQKKQLELECVKVAIENKTDTAACTRFR